MLTVCTGNICRSPQAEQLLRLRIPQAFDRTAIANLEVTSAGTRAIDGDTMDRYAAAEAVRLGVPDAAAHRARKLRRAQIADADLIITMTVDHRRAVASLSRRGHAKTFTLVEFAMIVEALADGSAAERIDPLGTDGFAAFMRRVVQASARVRARVEMPKPAMLLDVVDPYGYPIEVYRRSAETIDRKTGRLADALASLAEGALAQHKPLPGHRPRPLSPQ